MIFQILAAVAALAAASPDAAQTALIDRPGVGDMSLFGARSASRVAEPGLPGASAVHVEVAAPAAGSHPWDAGVGVVTTADIHKGDPVTAVFWARGETAGGRIAARLQGNDAPYDGIGDGHFDLDAAWRLYKVQGTAAEDFAAGHAGLSVSLNTQAQTVDIGPAYIFKTPVDAAGLEDRLRAIPVRGAVDAMIATPSGDRLAATLRLPAGPGPFPAVTVITGSGPWGRNPGDSLSLAMLDHGIAVLQFDKRGVGQSTGNLQDTQLADRVADTAAVAAWLRAQPGVDPRHTGVLGSSEGGAIAVSVVARDPKVSFVVSMAGPAVPIGDMIADQTEMNLLDAGFHRAKAEPFAKALRDAFAALRQATSQDDAVSRVKALLTPFAGTVMTQAAIDDAVARICNPADRTFMLYDPKVELEHIRVPVLGLYGTVDHQVLAVPNADAMRRGLAGDKDVTVVVLPGFNHLFQHARTGTRAEWSQLTEAQASDPALQKRIIDWIAAHTR